MCPVQILSHSHEEKPQRQMHEAKVVLLHIRLRRMLKMTTDHACLLLLCQGGSSSSIGKSI